MQIATGKQNTKKISKTRAPREGFEPPYRSRRDHKINSFAAIPIRIPRCTLFLVVKDLLKILYAHSLPLGLLFRANSQRSVGSRDGSPPKWLRNVSGSLSTPKGFSRNCSPSEGLCDDSITIGTTCQGPISKLCGDAGFPSLTQNADGKSHQCCKQFHGSPLRLRLSLIARIACRAFSGLTTE